MAYPNDEWQRKGATLSDKTARQEFGLTQDEIYDAIDAGTLQYRQAYMHRNPWLRLLRREVEALARARHGDRYVSEQQARAELSGTDARQPRDQAPADRVGRTRGAASQARLRSRRVNGPAPCAASHACQADEHQVEHPRTHKPAMLPAGRPLLQANPQSDTYAPIWHPTQYQPAASVRDGRQPRPPSSASLALTDPSEYGLRLRPPEYASGYSSGDSPWKATHTG